MIYLVEPYMDKNYSIQAHGDIEAVKAAAILQGGESNITYFFQGYCERSQWIMIELWTDDHDAIIDFVEAMAERLGTEWDLVGWGEI
jgi:hypothetical protein